MARKTALRCRRSEHELTEIPLSLDEGGRLSTYRRGRVAGAIFSSMQITVVQGSLTEGSETLLVNASNTNAALGSGVSSAIRQGCGPGYQDHITRELAEAFGGPMLPGQVLVTDAGTHPRARWVAHVAVMDYREGFTGKSFPTLAVIEDCCKNLLTSRSRPRRRVPNRSASTSGTAVGHTRAATIRARSPQSTSHRAAARSSTRTAR